MYSYVNNINTIEGGTHVAGFRRALTRVFKSYGDKQNHFEKAKVEIEGDDYREGLSAIISVKVPEPQFEGQTKTKLGNNEVSGIVDTTVSKVLEAYLEENPREAKNIIQKVILAAQARAAARKPGNWYNEKVYSAEADYRVNWPIVLKEILNDVNYTWWKEILRAEPQNRAVTGVFRPSCL